MSFPSRERGLKCRKSDEKGRYIYVVPLAGTWIEINRTRRGIIMVVRVVPLAGTWIEIQKGEGEIHK